MYVEEFTGNQLNLVAKTTVRKTLIDTFLKQSISSGTENAKRAQEIVDFEGALKLHADKSNVFDEKELVIYGVAYALDQTTAAAAATGTAATSGGQGTAGSGASFVDWKLTDFRGSYCTLRVRCTKRQVNNVRKWSTNSLWCVRGLQIAPTNGGKGATNGKVVFEVPSPKHLLRVGKVAQVVTCTGFREQPCDRIIPSRTVHHQLQQAGLTVPVSLGDTAAGNNLCQRCLDAEKKFKKRGRNLVRLNEESKKKRRKLMDPYHALATTIPPGRSVDTEGATSCASTRVESEPRINIVEEGLLELGPQLRALKVMLKVNNNKAGKQIVKDISRVCKKLLGAADSEWPVAVELKSYNVNVIYNDAIEVGEKVNECSIALVSVCDKLKLYTQIHGIVPRRDNEAANQETKAKKR
eukprot:GHVU01026485.1.p1 GENE.GHVU01026485.1~~GHVU01026485.1.p1  ORF type:complete len:410 (+),score=64.81 GHVU01026485.1:1491-2720(+)